MLIESSNDQTLLKIDNNDEISILFQLLYITDIILEKNNIEEHKKFIKIIKILQDEIFINKKKNIYLNNDDFIFFSSIIYIIFEHSQDKKVFYDDFLKYMLILEEENIIKTTDPNHIIQMIDLFVNFYSQNFLKNK